MWCITEVAPFGNIFFPRTCIYLSKIQYYLLELSYSKNLNYEEVSMIITLVNVLGHVPRGRSQDEHLCTNDLWRKCSQENLVRKWRNQDRKSEEVKPHVLFRAKAHNRSFSPFLQGNPGGEAGLSTTRQLGGGQASYSCTISHCRGPAQGDVNSQVFLLQQP